MTKSGVFRDPRRPLWRYWLARCLIHAALGLLPPGRVKVELHELLRDWSFGVFLAVSGVPQMDYGRCFECKAPLFKPSPALGPVCLKCNPHLLERVA